MDSLHLFSDIYGFLRMADGDAHADISFVK